MNHSCRLSRRSWRRGYTGSDSNIHPSIAPDRAARESGGRSRPSLDEIAKLAYSYWEARGGVGGSALEDWLRAERALQLR
jgi:hypothetical protein